MKMRLKKLILILIFISFYIKIYSNEYKKYNLELKKILLKKQNNINLTSKNNEVYFENLFNKINDFNLKIDLLIRKNMKFLFSNNINAKFISSYNIKNAKLKYELLNNYNDFFKIWIEQNQEEIKFIFKIDFTYIKLSEFNIFNTN